MHGTQTSDPRIPEAVVRSAVADAFLAPSSHNAQPCSALWARSEAARGAVRAALGSGVRSASSYLVICLVPERCLSSLPQHRTEMMLSTGAFAENLVVSLRAQGVTCEVDCCPPPAALGKAAERWLGDWQPAAVLRLVGPGEPDPACVAVRAALPLRTTNRAPYQPRLPERTASRLRQARSIAFPDAAELCSLEVIEQRQTREHLGDFFARHAGRELRHRASWAETYRHIRFSGRADDGLPIGNLLARPVGGLSGAVLGWLLAPRVMSGLSRVGAAHLFARKAGKVVAAAPLALYLRARSEAPDEAAVIAAGARMQAVWLAATEDAVAVHPVSVALQHEELREAFARACQAPAGRGLWFARVGVPTASVPPAPRPAEPWLRVRVA